MCQLKSCLVLKDRIYCPDYDSHDQMLNELQIADTIKNAESLFVRVELFPPYGNLLVPLEGWRLRVDQDVLPGWWDKDYYEPLVRAEVKKWVDEHLIYSGKRTITKGTYYALNDAEIVAENNSIIHAFNHAKVFAYDRSLVVAHHNTTVSADVSSVVHAEDNCKVTAHADALATLYGYAQASVYDRAQAYAYDKSEVKAYDETTVICQNNAKIICNDMSRCFVHDADEVVCNGNSVAYLWNRTSATANNNSVIFKPENDDSEITLNNNALTTTLVT